MKGRRPTQGRTLAVMQMSGGSQSFNAVNTLRLLGRWMRMFTIPNQSSVPMAYKEFDATGRMRPSSYYDRIVDVMEELVRMTVLLRPHAAQLVDRYSERKARGVAVATEDHSAVATEGRRRQSGGGFPIALPETGNSGDRVAGGQPAACLGQVRMSANAR